MTLQETAPAKINLGLSITGKRADGYHTILSVFQTVGLCDILRLSSSCPGELVCNHPDVPTDQKNLILKAETLFCEKYGIKERTGFILKKKIPVGGGLGGGSADAAAALRGLRSLYGIDAENETLKEIACALGSDIPFLVIGGTAVVSGRGEVIKEVQWPFNFYYVLVAPGFGVSTAWAYSRVSRYGENADAYGSMTDKLLNGTLSRDEFFGALNNDFEPAVFDRYSVLDDIKHRLLKLGACRALMTGSGSTILGIFDDNEEADMCGRSLSDDGFKTFVVAAHESLS
ncbi:4-(cytidine 5'-diphospho)-2-C-methyl-D-erythritol kinase [Candidatus Omnitrophota bacterium]